MTSELAPSSSGDPRLTVPVIVSVILVCKNPGPRVQTAVHSVRTQPGVKIDLIVIDAASTDGTREWLESQRAHLAKFVSEPDRGLYEAMNKGVAAARTEWVLFLGADDRLEAGAITAALPVLNQTSADIVVGEAVYDDGRSYRLAPHPRVLARNFVHHQATFYRRRLFEAHGGFDPALTVMGDYDFNLRLWQKPHRFEAITPRIAQCGGGGLSDAGRWRGYAEEIRVRHRHFAAWRCWWWDAGSVARFLRKKIVRSFTSHG
jgi:glycosyltransferase involved in cell wall biosynthesis